MLNTGSQSGNEANISASYLNSYMDCVENMPDDLQRQITRMRELDITYRSLLEQLLGCKKILMRGGDGPTSRRGRMQVFRILIELQEIGDEKLHASSKINEMIENKTRNLDANLKKLDIGKEQENTEPTKDSAADRNKRTRRSANRVDHTPNIVETPPESEPQPKRQQKKRKPRRSKPEPEREPEGSPGDIPIDPDEPTYCLCEQVSFGEMIGCDNDLCPIEWFHFSCVGLNSKPKGKWFCPKCRGDRPTVMKPKAKLFKELQKYNKEKEEKS